MRGADRRTWLPAGLLGLLSFGAAATWLAAHGRRLLALAVMVAMLLTIRVYDLRVQISPAFQQQMAAQTGYVDDMASAMRALPPGMKVQPLDTAEGALQAMFAARREQASPIVYDFVLFSGSAEAQSKARQVLLQSIGDTRPAILITNQGWPDKRRLGHERVSSVRSSAHTIHPLFARITGAAFRSSASASSKRWDNIFHNADRFSTLVAVSVCSACSLPPAIHSAPFMAST